MNAGTVYINGDAGDVLGYGMRGGRVFVKGDVGYRVGIHMKAFENLVPVVCCGGNARAFFGEYMAGGIVILLDLYGQSHKGNFMGTGMHGGAIYLRGVVEKEQVGNQVEISLLDELDREILDRYVSEFIERFPDLGLSKEEILKDEFVKLAPKSKRPYSKIYAY